MHRRNFVKLSLVSATYLLSACNAGESSSNKSANLDGFLINQALSIPPLLDPIPDVNGVKQFNLNIEERTHNFYTDVTSNTFGINQSYLGNTLRIKNGDKVSINYTNKLQEATTMHGHGMHVPASMDGGPNQRIEPNTTWSAIYTINQKASTNWYHPHLMGKTAEHVYKGLTGFIILEDSQSDVLALPKTYGKDDIPLVIQDRNFLNKQLSYTPVGRDIMRGYRGDVLLTNGQIQPKLNAKAGLLRLRILNGSNGSLYNFSFSNGLVFSQIATDNSFLESPVELTSLKLSPSERAEIVVDLANDANGEVLLKVVELIDNRSFTALRISVDAQAALVSTLPSSLTTHEVIDINQVVRTRNFTLEGSGNMGNPILTINNKAMLMSRIDETLNVNELEIWHIENTMNLNHNFHIHATHFRPYKRNGSTANILANEQGYKDCIHLGPNETVDILVKMLDYTDASGKYMYHCHYLEHEDAGMMGQFVVV